MTTPAHPVTIPHRADGSTMPTELVLHPRVAQWLVQALARLTGTFALAWGVFTISGGRIRWSGPSYRDALAAPGAPASWGFVLGSLGVLVIAATFARRPRLVSLALGGIALWALLFAAAFFKTWLARPDAGAGPWITNLLIVGFSCILAAGYWQDHGHR